MPVSTINSSTTMTQDTQPLVSVVIFGYNRAVLIRDAIESVINQTYKNIELILMDNGSTDNTPAVMQEYAAKHPFIKVLRNEKNERPTISTIRGIEAATGEFISILFDDDYYLPEKIEKQVECFRTLDPSYGVVYSSGYRLNVESGEQWLQKTFHESGWVIRKMFQRYAEDGMIMPISPLIRRECFSRYPFRPEVLSEGDDIYFRFALGYQFKYLDIPLVVMRDHHTNMGKAIQVNAPNFMNSMSKLLREPELKKEDIVELKKYVARVFRNYGWQGFRVLGDKAWTRECLRISLQWDMWQLFHWRFIAATLSLFIPKSFQAPLNRVATHLRKNREIIAFKSSYT